MYMKSICILLLRFLSDIFNRWVSLRNYQAVQGYNIDQSFYQSISATLDGDLRGVVDLRFL